MLWSNWSFFWYVFRGISCVPFQNQMTLQSYKKIRKTTSVLRVKFFLLYRVGKNSYLAEF